MKTVAIIQARMGSTRLPGKVLLPIGDTNVIQMIVDRCKANPLINDIIIATTKNTLDNKITSYCQDNHISFYRGSEENVLERVYKAAQFYKADIIVDITADCPFIDLMDLNRYLGPIKIGSVDYVSNVIERSFPDGLDLQCYSFKALDGLYKLSMPSRYYQHSGWNFTQYQGLFKILNIHAEGALNWPELRITLDTAQDYAVINIIYMRLGADATPLEIVNFMCNNPKIMAINQAIQAKTPGEL